MLSRIFHAKFSILAAGLGGSAMRSKIVAPALLIQPRHIVTIVSEEDDEYEEDAELSIFAHKAVHMGSEPYPNYKREALMKSEKMKMRKNRQYGKRANYKVRALVDFIEFKNSRKFQD